MLPTYSIKLTNRQWESLTELAFEPFRFRRKGKLTRHQWESLAYILLGKAQRIDAGDYKAIQAPFDAEWSAELRKTAGEIMDFLRAI